MWISGGHDTIYNVLKRSKIDKVCDLIVLNYETLCNFKGIGKITAEQIIKILHCFGIDIMPLNFQIKNNLIEEKEILLRRYNELLELKKKNIQEIKVINHEMKLLIKKMG